MVLVGPVEINYYKDLDAFESTSPVMINSNPTMHNYYAYYRSMYIGERPDPIELPAGANPVRMVLKGKIDDTGLTARDFTRVVKLANVGDKVYIQGLSTDVPEGWAMGTLADGKLTIPRGQFMGFGEQAAIYLLMALTPRRASSATSSSTMTRLPTRISTTIYSMSARPANPAHIHGSISPA